MAINWGKELLDSYGVDQVYLQEIKVPTLLINALNDSFLSQECYPIKEAKEMKNFHLLIPNYGGHVGFTTFGRKGVFWSEQRALEFAEMPIEKIKQ